MANAADLAVQGTTEEASISKLSASDKGYFEDHHLKFFVKPSTYRRSPLVHRGYYSRVAGMRKAIMEFFNCCVNAGCKEAQFVNLGAGLDSTCFWLAGELKNKIN